MAIYQCLFYKDGIVAYWENIEAQSESGIQEMLQEKLRRRQWNLAEAWLDDTLSYRMEAPPHPG
jgi:hypothetical protein